MEKFKKTYSTICIVIALLITFVVITVDAIRTPTIVAKINNPPTETDYQILKDYADTYAKTFDIDGLKAEDITVSKVLKENYIEITAEELRCKVVATYPIVYEFKSDGEFKTVVAYDEGKYEKISNIPSVATIVIATIIFALLCWSVSIIIMYYPVIWIGNLIIIIKKGIQKNNE